MKLSKWPQLLDNGQSIWRLILTPFLLSRLLILGAGLAAGRWGTMRPQGWRVSSTMWIDMWARWDSGFYLDIASGGYSYIPGQISSVAFFPLYPLLMRWLAWQDSSRVSLTIAGWLISNISFLGALYLLYRLVDLDYQRQSARLTIWLLCFFPTSFFFSVVYTEGLFLLLTVGAFYFARRDQWLLAGLFGGLSSATRVVGLLILIPLAIEKIKQKPGNSRDWLYFALMPLGFLAFLIFLNFQFGDPLIFSRIQIAWGRPSSVTGILERLADLFSDPDLLLRVQSVWMDILFTGLAVIIFVVVLRKQRLSYLIYTAYSLAVPLSTVSVDSMPRYLIVAFPLFIAGATWLNRSRFSRFAVPSVIGIFALIQAVLVARWTLWFWVA